MKRLGIRGLKLADWTDTDRMAFGSISQGWSLANIKAHREAFGLLLTFAADPRADIGRPLLEGFAGFAEMRISPSGAHCLLKRLARMLLELRQL
jgi:hypothetical protein